MFYAGNRCGASLRIVNNSSTLIGPTIDESVSSNVTVATFWVSILLLMRYTCRHSVQVIDNSFPVKVMLLPPDTSRPRPHLFCKTVFPWMVMAWTVFESER